LVNPSAPAPVPFCSKPAKELDVAPLTVSVAAVALAFSTIGVPTINLDGEADGVRPISRTVDPSAKKFTGFYERRILPTIGHNVPQEAPAETVAAIRTLLRSTPH